MKNRLVRFVYFFRIRKLTPDKNPDNPSDNITFAPRGKNLMRKFEVLNRFFRFLISGESEFSSQSSLEVFWGENFHCPDTKNRKNQSKTSNFRIRFFPRGANVILSLGLSGFLPGVSLGMRKKYTKRTTHIFSMNRIPYGATYRASKPIEIWLHRATLRDWISAVRRNLVKFRPTLDSWRSNSLISAEFYGPVSITGASDAAEVGRISWKSTCTTLIPVEHSRCHNVILLACPLLDWVFEAGWSLFGGLQWAPVVRGANFFTYQQGYPSHKLWKARLWNSLRVTTVPIDGNRRESEWSEKRQFCWNYGYNT